MRYEYGFGYEFSENFSIESLKSDINSFYQTNKDFFNEDEFDVNELTRILMYDYYWTDVINYFVDDSIISDSTADRIYDNMYESAEDNFHTALRNFIDNHKRELMPRGFTRTEIEIE